MIIRQFPNGQPNNVLVFHYKEGYHVSDRYSRIAIRLTYRRLRQEYDLSPKQVRKIVWNLMFASHLSSGTTEFKATGR